MSGTPAPAEFDNLVGIVTGAGSGIGRACAREFALRSAAVAVLDIDEWAARETVRQIEVAGGAAIAIAGQRRGA